MTGAEHYRQAQLWRDRAQECWEHDEPADAVQAAALIAQVHATLALAAATALSQAGQMFVPSEPPA